MGKEVMERAMGSPTGRAFQAEGKAMQMLRVWGEQESVWLTHGRRAVDRIGGRGRGRGALAFGRTLLHEIGSQWRDLGVSRHLTLVLLW